MRKKLAIIGLSAGLVGGGVAGFALTGSSGIAGAQSGTTTTVATNGTTNSTGTTSNGTTARPDPSTHLSDALAPLVKDGTITQAQADKVIAALKAAGPVGGDHGGPGGGRGGRGPGLDAAATALGITADELRTELQAGKTIAAVATEKGVALSKVTDAMLAAEKERLAADVTAGRITQAQADEHLTNESAEITARVNSTGPVGGRDGGHDGQPPAGAPGSDTTTTTAA
ncbi:MAG: hypothetical protein U0Q22_01050 [Acidimicrobiales bacterium]